jgi:16S rRNA (uracil1498-N3)-methyltransferase
MLRLFVDAALVAGRIVDLPAGPARHVQVRRLQPGEALVLFDGRGGEWRARVHAIGRQAVQVEPMAHEANERMDWLVEKATELGAAALQPATCERSVLRLEGERAARRRAHWQALAVAAAEQCGRTRVPQVHAVRDLGEILPSCAPDARRWLLSPVAQAAPQRPTDKGPLIVLSGPEGGLAPAEEAAARAAGFEAVGLGPRVLRAETAPLALLAWLGLP